MAEQIIAFQTTQVSAEKTAGEIEDMLRKANVTKIGKEFESGRIKAIYFQMETLEGSHPFLLPVNVEAVYTLMIREKNKSSRFKSYLQSDVQKVHDQAERVAWRIIHWWLKAQLALVETEMVTVNEIFLPYMLVGDGETLFQRWKGENYPALMEGVVDEQEEIPRRV